MDFSLHFYIVFVVNLFKKKESLQKKRKKKEILAKSISSHTKKIKKEKKNYGPLPVINISSSRSILSLTGRLVFFDNNVQIDAKIKL